jgi:hypothetical protein
MLVAVFAGLDAWLGVAAVSNWVASAWVLLGLLLLYLGVRFDPEV